MLYFTPKLFDIYTKLNKYCVQSTISNINHDLHIRHHQFVPKKLKKETTITKKLNKYSAKRSYMGDKVPKKELRVKIYVRKRCILLNYDTEQTIASR